MQRLKWQLEKTSCMEFKINAQLPMPQPSDDRVDRASVFGSVDSKFDSDSRQPNDSKIGIRSFPA